MCQINKNKMRVVELKKNACSSEGRGSLEEHAEPVSFGNWENYDFVQIETGRSGHDDSNYLWRQTMSAPRSLLQTCHSLIGLEIGFNVETLEYKNICFTVWDIIFISRISSLQNVPTKGSP